MTSASPVFQGFPPQNVPLVDGNGHMNPVWYRFFLNLYKVTGMQYISPSISNQQSGAYSPAYVLYNPTVTSGTPYGFLHVLRSSDGSFLHGGTVVLTAP